MKSEELSREQKLSIVSSLVQMNPEKIGFDLIHHGLIAVLVPWLKTIREEISDS